MTTRILAHGGAVGLVLELGVLAAPIVGLVVAWISQRRAERTLDGDDERDTGLTR